MGENELRGYSDVLQLYVCWEDGNLRFYDPEEDAYLLTYREQDESRMIAETERDEERERRLAAQARIRHLEERIRQLEG